MPDRSYTYRVIVDTSSARTQAAAIKRVFERELSTIQAQNVQLVNPAALRNVQTAIAQQTQAQQQAAQQIAQTQQQVTAATATQSQQRIAASQTEAAARVRNAQTAADQMIAQERRVTQQTLDEQRNRQQATGGLGSALGGALKGAAAGFLTIQGLRLVANYATETARLDTQIRRTEKAFVIMAGSVGQAESRLIAIQKAANGAVDRMTAMQIANQAAALKLAKTSEEFGNLARAAKLITFVSPTIKDINDALTQLSLFSSNEASFMRADQLGLSVREVKDRMAELRAENSGLDGSTAKLQASIEILNQKYGTLLDSTEAQTSGVEKLNVAWSEFIQGASGVGSAFDRIAASAAGTVDELATVFGVANSRAILDVTKANAEVAKFAADSGIINALTAGGAERNAKAYEFLAATLEKLNEGVASNIPAAVEYRQQVEQIAVSADRWGVVTDDQLNQLRDIRQQYNIAAAAADAYAKANAGIAESQQKAAAAAQFGNTLTQFGTAMQQLGNVQFSGIEGIADWRKELVDLRSEFLQAGTLTDEQTARFEFLSKAASAAINPTTALGTVTQGLGSSFLQNNQAAAEYVQQMLDLSAAYVNGKVSAEQYAVGVEQIKSGLQEAASAGLFQFNGALVRSTLALSELDQLIAQGTPGLTQWHDELVAIRDDIVSTGTATDEQSARIKTLATAINDAATAQADYGAVVNQLGDAFFATNDRARDIAEQLNNLSTAYASGAINADAYAASTGQLRDELDNLAVNENAISTTSLDQLSQSILALDTAVAGGVPGLETLRDQALNLESELGTTGLATADQAAQIEYLSAVASVASDSTGLLADINGALGDTFLQNNEYAAGLVEKIILLTAAHANGTISSEVFAGALQVLTGQMVSTGEQAGFTAAQINAAFGELQAFSAAQSSVFGSTGGFIRGQRLAQSNVAAEQAKERERVRIAQEKAAKESARAFKSAAKESARAFEKAAKDFESALRNVPGLFGRSQVTDRQLKLAKAGVPQNFADDFLRRLEDEINQNKDIWPDVSIEQAREALRKVGVQAVDDSKLAFEQLVDAWESGLLFSDKSNLALINSDAVQASIDLQEKTKQGQQNIIDHFKNVIGIAVDAATGVQVDTSGISAPTTTDKNVPKEITVTAPDDIQQVLTSGSVTITSATVSTVALQSLATQLATQAFTIQISQLTISTTATQALSEQVSASIGAIKTTLDSASVPMITPVVKLDAANILKVNDIIGALTPAIYPTLALTETEKTAFVSAVEVLKPGVATRLFADATAMSDYIVSIETNVKPGIATRLYADATAMSDYIVNVEKNVKPGIATTLYTTIEEIAAFKDLVSGIIKPKVEVQLTLPKDTLDQQGNIVSALPDIAGQFADAVDRQIKDNADRFTQQGATVANYLALGAYNFGFPDITARYADLIDLQITANAERFSSLGTAFANAIANGATTFVFPDVSLIFVEAIEAQVRINQDRFMRQGTNAMNLIVHGMNGFDFSFIATAMIAGVRAGMEQEAIKAALGDVGAGAMRTIRDGLENEASNISWAGILTAAITESVLSELADSLEGQ